MKGVVLLSGGLDSATVLEIAKSQGFEIYGLSFNYGQRHAVELEAVKKIISRSPIQEHRTIRIDLSEVGGSALTDKIAVPKTEIFKLSQEIPVTYVPARNTIFLSLALGFAETIQAYDIFIGSNLIDGNNYPDCRPEFISAFERVANLATAAVQDPSKKFRIHAPLLKMSKAETIRAGLALGVDYSLTSSCYDPSVDGLACGHCDACHLRMGGFRENGIEDPIRYS